LIGIAKSTSNNCLANKQGGAALEDKPGSHFRGFGKA